MALFHTRFKSNTSVYIFPFKAPLPLFSMDSGFLQVKKKTGQLDMGCPSSSVVWVSDYGATI